MAPAVRPHRRVGPCAMRPYEEWPATVPAVARCCERAGPARGVTLLVGENGSGKSTIVEAVAMAFGLSPEGGHAARHATDEPPSRPLHRWIRLERWRRRPRWGFFLRAETCTATTPTWRTGPARTSRPAVPRDEPRRVVPGAARHRGSTPPGCTASTSPRPRCRSPRRSPCVGHAPRARAPAARRSSARPTPRCWRRSPARRSSRSARGACARRRTRSWSWWRTGSATSTPRCATCATSSTPTSDAFQ